MNSPNKQKSIEEEIRDIKKQTLKVLTIIFLGILSSIIYWIYFEEDLLVESQSPFDDKKVIINEVGNWFIGGSNKIKIYFKEDGRTRNFKRVEVDNFRESNTKERYNIVWIDENRISIAMVFERSTQGLEYNFTTNSIEME
ncbi:MULTISPECIES: hypothetical protein [Solibacillus]|uniref:Uncharacterized protein n=1 Tax=Solibacillus merdavium TaxID=2762218 RepID=A0ABR8XN25_9BACL|nr:hypothetical protein [Solibacillus merdavium]MBD8033335.1 hypothetical protein [Solibacillus merdavium]